MSVQAIVTKAPTKTILIVEDNPLNMKLFNDVLESSGYRTRKTNDGRQAISIARDDRPDLILTRISQMIGNFHPTSP
jgi:CheY-like chemotaxis protein